MRETHRFQTLVNYFTSPQEFQIEFMVACMQFINIVVHSVEVWFIHLSLKIIHHGFNLLGHELPGCSAIRVHSPWS